MHKHKCPSCRCVWEHGDECGGNEIAHRCPQCGTEQFVKYGGVLTSGFLQMCSRVSNPSLPNMVETVILLGYTGK